MSTEHEAKFERIIYDSVNETYELLSAAGERIVLLSNLQARHLSLVYNSDKTLISGREDK